MNKTSIHHSGAMRSIIHTPMHNTVSVTTDTYYGGAPDPLWVTETRGIETLWIEQDCVPSGLNLSTVHTERTTTTIWKFFEVGSIPLFTIVTHIRVKFTNIFNYFGKINVSDEATSYFMGVPFKKINRKFSEYKWRVYFFFFWLLGRLYKWVVLAQTACCSGRFVRTSTNGGFLWYGEKTEFFWPTVDRGNFKGVCIQWDLIYMGPGAWTYVDQMSLLLSGKCWMHAARGGGIQPQIH